MQQEAKATGKLEKKLKVKLGGYAVRQQQFQTRIDEARREKDRLATELKTFQRLEKNEERSIVKRTQVLIEEVCDEFFPRGGESCTLCDLSLCLIFS